MEQEAPRRTLTENVGTGVQANLDMHGKEVIRTVTPNRWVLFGRMSHIEATLDRRIGAM
jgi:hypothetical protein